VVFTEHQRRFSGRLCRNTSLRRAPRLSQMTRCLCSIASTVYYSCISYVRGLLININPSISEYFECWKWFFCGQQHQMARFRWGGGRHDQGMREHRSGRHWRFSGNTQMGRRWFKRWRMILNKIKELFYAIMEFYSPFAWKAIWRFQIRNPKPNNANFPHQYSHKSIRQVMKFINVCPFTNNIFHFHPISSHHETVKSVVFDKTSH
jgi:hypothetical protein